MHTRLSKLLAGLSAAALVANAACLATQNAGLSDMANSYGTAAELVPFYGAMIAAYALVSGAGILSVAVPLWRGRVPEAWRFGVASALFFVGLFFVRFGFYMMHMTAGLGI